MAKRYTEPKEKKPTISDKEKLLHNLIVKRSFEKTDKYDPDIERLEKELAWFYYGAR